MRSTRMTIAALALALPLSIAACGSESVMPVTWTSKFASLVST